MTRVFLADALPLERSALRLILSDLNMEIAGEAADWSTTLVQVPLSRADLLVVDWDLLPNSPKAALDELHTGSSAMQILVLTSYLATDQQAAFSAGADAFISKGDFPERVAECLRMAEASIRS